MKHKQVIQIYKQFNYFYELKLEEKDFESTINFLCWDYMIGDNCFYICVIQYKDICDRFEGKNEESIYSKILNKYSLSSKKQKSREADQKALDSGEKTNEDLYKENSMFSGLDFSNIKIRLDKGNLY